MQAAKDSFFRTLQARLAITNPQRTVFVDGATKPALLATENEPFPSRRLQFETFYLSWMGAVPVAPMKRTLSPRYELLAQLEYFLQGTAELLRPFADRGRILGAMDRELMEMLFPGFAEKKDYSTTPPTALGSQLYWGWTPELRTVIDGEGSVLRRIATVRISFQLESLPN